MIWAFLACVYLCVCEGGGGERIFIMPFPQFWSCHVSLCQSFDLNVQYGSVCEIPFEQVVGV